MYIRNFAILHKEGGDNMLNIIIFFLSLNILLIDFFILKFILKLKKQARLLSNLESFNKF